MMITHDQLLEQLGYLAHRTTIADSREEAFHYARCAYSCAIATMMLDGDLEHLPVADRDLA